jgi:hypothetical protein
MLNDIQITSDYMSRWVVLKRRVGAVTSQRVLHKTPYKEMYITGSSTCSTKELSIHLTKILSAVKEGQQKYCETVYSRSGINHMWILKNSKDLLDNLKSRSFSHVSSIKTFDFSTLYTTLPHDKLKTRLKETIHKAFSHLWLARISSLSNEVGLYVVLLEVMLFMPNSLIRHSK